MGNRRTPSDSCSLFFCGGSNGWYVVYIVVIARNGELGHSRRRLADRNASSWRTLPQT